MPSKTLPPPAGNVIRKVSEKKTEMKREGNREDRMRNFDLGYLEKYIETILPNV